MTKYLLLIKGSFAAWNKLEQSRRTEIISRFEAYAGELAELGYMRGGAGCDERSFRILSPSASAAEALVKPETADMVTGYFIIETTGEKEAFDAARRCPAFGCGEYVELIPCGKH